MQKIEPQEEDIKTTTSAWAWVSMLLFLSLVGGATAVYEYAHFDGVNAKQLHANYIKKEYISFDDLRYEEQKEYVLSSAVKMKDKEIEHYKDMLKKAQESKTSEEFTKKCPEEKITISKSIKMNVNDTSAKTMLKERLQCDDAEIGSYRITQECKEKIKSFIAKVEAKTTIEIIPLVDKNDFAILEALSDLGNSAYVKSQEGVDVLCTMVNSMGLNVHDCASSWLDSLHLSKSELERLSFIANTGLGKLRSNEAGWYISTLAKNEIRPVNYHITTSDKRGFIIRLYK